MRDRGWDSTIPDRIRSNQRYVSMLDSTGNYYEKDQDADVAEYISLTNGGEQWHIRLYDVGSYRFGNHVVCGQAHRDPWDHGVIYRWSGGLTQKPDYRFNDSRVKTVNDWADWGWGTRTEYLGNTIDEANGYIERCTRQKLALKSQRS
jgi:hypothetical protein